MADDLKEIFAANLQRLRKQKNISMVELAEEIKVSQSTVSDWENGNKMPRSGSIEKLADFFGVNKTDLLVKKGEQNDLNQASQKRELSIKEALDSVMTYDGKPLSDNDREILRGIIEGYLDNK